MLSSASKLASRFATVTLKQRQQQRHIFASAAPCCPFSSLGVDGRRLVLSPPLAQQTQPTLFNGRRFLATNRKDVMEAKNAKRLKLQARKKKKQGATKEAAATTTDGVDPAATQLHDDTSADSNNVDDDVSPKQPFLQHQEWVNFQQSIQVDGFQTGQVTTAEVTKKSRGGKQARARRAKEELARSGVSGAEKTMNTTSLKFPAIRYSPEETEELLKLAFDTLPKREGKRGTRNLRRQEQRWKTVRQNRAVYKAQLLQAHYRRMEKRKWKRDEVRTAKAKAPDMCAADVNYQAQVLTKWAGTMFGSTTGSSSSRSSGRVEE